MNVLAFDTCMAACSVALLRAGEEERLFRRYGAMERGHSEALFPMIREVMEEAGLGFGEIGRIAVTRGPGTFTGLRAGIAAARGLALGCGAPVVAAGSLEVMALGVLERLGPQACQAGFLVAHDARRGELYVQNFTAGGEPACEAALACADEAARRAASCGLVAGSGAAAVAAEAGRLGLDIRAALPDLLPDAAHLARLAATRAPEPGPVRALYLRAPDAKPQTDKHLARA